MQVCGKCGGEIGPCEEFDPRLVGLAGKIPDDKPIFMCVLCSQPYWWNENQNSRSSRALSLADRLYTCIQRGVGLPLQAEIHRDSSGNVCRDHNNKTTGETNGESSNTTIVPISHVGDTGDCSIISKEINSENTAGRNHYNNTVFSQNNYSKIHILHII